VWRETDLAVGLKAERLEPGQQFDGAIETLLRKTGMPLGFPTLPADSAANHSWELFA